MSLLDNGPDEVTVYAEVETVDEYRNKILAPDLNNPVLVRGRWQPSTFDEAAQLGQEQDTVYRFVARDFPAGPYGRVDFDGASWDVLGAPKQHRGSTATRHYTAYLKRR
jgi:hypothetical protein